jgi:hypothetical protein
MKDISLHRDINRLKQLIDLKTSLGFFEQFFSRSHVDERSITERCIPNRGRRQDAVNQATHSKVTVRADGSI